MKKRMLISINSLGSNSVGISLVNLLTRLDYSKYDVDLVFANASGNLVNMIPKSVNIVLSPFTNKKLGFFEKLKYYKRYDFSLMYDVGNVELSKFTISCSRNSAIYLHKNYRSIYSAGHNYDKFILNYKIFEFDKFVFPNKELMNLFTNIHPDALDRSYVLEYLVNDKYIINASKASIEVDKPNYKTLLLTAGTLNDRAKNYTLMIKMMSNLVKINNHVELWILGDGPDLVNLKMLVNELKLSNYIKFFGFKVNPYPYMSIADYFINTADSFDSSTAIIEAKVLEKPILSTGTEIVDENIHVISADVNKIHLDVNEIISKRIKYKGVNNFWVINQKSLNELNEIISKGKK